MTGGATRCPDRAARKDRNGLIHTLGQARRLLLTACRFRFTTILRYRREAKCHEKRHNEKTGPDPVGNRAAELPVKHATNDRPDGAAQRTKRAKHAERKPLPIGRCVAGDERIERRHGHAAAGSHQEQATVKDTGAIGVADDDEAGQCKKYAGERRTPLAHSLDELPGNTALKQNQRDANEDKHPRNVDRHEVVLLHGIKRDGKLDRRKSGPVGEVNQIRAGHTGQVDALELGERIEAALGCVLARFSGGRLSDSLNTTRTQFNAEIISAMAAGPENG